MERLTYRSPSTWTDCLDMGGSRAFTRKAMIWQRSIADSISALHGETLIAMAFMAPDREGRVEFALCIKPDAAPFMLQLCRFAHLTLTAMAETGSVIVCHVGNGGQLGARMARLVGFRHVEGTLWTFGGASNGQSSIGHIRWRPGAARRQRGEEAGGGKPPAADDLE